MSFALVAGMGFEPHDLRVMSPTSYQAALPRDIKLRFGVSPPFHNPKLTSGEVLLCKTRTVNRKRFTYVIATRRRRRIVLFFASYARLENSLLCAVSLRKNDTQSFLLVHPTSYQAALPRDINTDGGAGDRSRTGTILSYHGILSPGRLPIPPLRLFVYLRFSYTLLYHTTFILSTPFFKNVKKFGALF